MMVVFALMLTVLVGAVMLGVDLAHLRAETERAQQAANAAALAGVVFLPNYVSQAEYRASEEAIKSGFATDATRGITVTPSLVPSYNYRLRVSITEPVSSLFGRLLGPGAQRISVSATAEFLPPLQMGSPDYVLGMPVFPSYLTPADSAGHHAPQNFYLNQNGLYTYKEQGDPYSPFFESFTGPSYGAGVADNPNPCTTTADPSICPGTGVTANVLRSGTNAFDGYKYVISVPYSETVLVKLFNPFSELRYNATARCWDAGYKGASSQILSGYYGACDGQRVAAPTSPLAPRDIRPQYQPASTGQTCVLGTEANGNSGTACRNENIDGPQLTNFGPMTTTSWGYHGPDWTAQPGLLPANSLEFSLTGPTNSLLDSALGTKQINLLPSAASTPKCAMTTENCVIAAPFDAKDDPARCDTTTCVPSQVAYKFVNYAILHGPGYFQLKVNSIPSVDATSGNQMYGEGNSAYGIAVCNAATDATYTGTTSPLGNASTRTYVTSDPVSTVPGTGGWNASACLSPNDPTMCPDPRLASPGQCVQLYGEGKLPLYNYLGAGSSLIPLGYIPADYAGHAINVDLFDPGDVGASSTAPQTIFGCLVPTTSSSGRVPENSMEVLTPAGDTQCSGTANHVDGNSNTAGTNVQQSSLPYTFSTAPDLPASGYATNTRVSENANQPLDVGNGTRPYNGTWVHMTLSIPSDYPTMVNGNGSSNSAFGAYWKVLYRIGGDSTDVTTWSLSVEGSAVHLVTPS